MILKHDEMANKFIVDMEGATIITDKQDMVHDESVNCDCLGTVELINVKFQTPPKVDMTIFGRIKHFFK